MLDGFALGDAEVVYFIECAVGGAIKIGTSRRVGERLLELQAGCPFLLRLIATMPGGREEERVLHQRFASARMYREWFEPTEVLLQFIRELLR